MPPNTQLFKVRPTRLECLFGKRHLLQGNPCVGGQCEHRADLTLASTRLHPQATAGRETDACSSRGHGAAHTSGCRPPSHRFPGRSRPPHSLPSAHFAFPLHPLAFPFQYLLSFSFLLHAGWQTCKLRGGPAGRMAHTPTSKRQVSFNTECQAYEVTIYTSLDLDRGQNTAASAFDFHCSCA